MLPQMDLGLVVRGGSVALTAASAKIPAMGGAA